MHARRSRFFVAITVLFYTTLARGSDWPTYQHDIARSGVTSGELEAPLKLAWTFRTGHAPQPAWEPPRAEPVEGYVELPRVRFDDAYHVVVAGGSAYFGSSADNKVYALDVGTGKVRWTYFTGGPVRLAPTVWENRVYVGSDDGHVYCLAASDGDVVWKRRIGPSDQRLLGHKKMVSLWPLRTGVLVDNGIAYYGAGIFPAEGVYMEAVDAKTGDFVWRNDTCGETTDSRISFQGYLLASESILYAPLWRVSPAAFDRPTGKFRHTTYFGKNIGGTYALLVGEHLYTGTEEVLGYQAQSTGRFAWFQGRRLIVTSDTSYMVSDTEMMAVGRKNYPKASLKRFSLRDQRTRLGRDLRRPRRDRKKLAAAIESDLAKLAAIDRGEADGQRSAIEKTIRDNKEKLAAVDKKLAPLEAQWSNLEEQWNSAGSTMESSVQWRVQCECPDSLILAGRVLFAGGEGQVIAVDSVTGEKLWTGEVDGKAKGLAAAAGRLFVSTDTGAIHTFGAPDCAALGEVAEETTSEPYPRDELTAMYEAAAERIVRETRVRRGYGLVLGGGKGRLALELARRTELTIYAIERDAKQASIARKALAAAGVYGSRVSVDVGSPTKLPYSDYFANLIVSDSALRSGLKGLSARELWRVLKPHGGVAMIGQVKGRGMTPDSLRRWLKTGGVPGARIVEKDGVWAKVKRGALPGAGKWTQQYANAGNTACSDDTVVKAPLGLLWFGDPGPLQMISRHRRAAAPLSVNGILFVQGEHAANAYDAYNGLKLWARPIPNVVRASVSHDCSNLAADDESFYVAARNECYRLNATTGEIMATYKVPAEGRAWGYVAHYDGMVFGSTARGRVCDSVFAFSAKSGKLKWVHQGHSIEQTSISISSGRVFLVDSHVTPEQREEALRKRRRGAKTAEAEKAIRSAPVRSVVALKASSGKPAWQKPIDLSGCVGGSHYCALGTMATKDALVIFGIYMDGHYWQEFFAGQFESRRVLTLSPKTGRTLWAKHIAYRVRPLIIEDTLHAEPWAFDLKTGEPRMRTNPVTGRKEPWQWARPGHHCGCPAANKNCLFFRSYFIGYYDLIKDFGTKHFGAQRTGCWINFIPANGVLCIPEASSGCMCPFPNMCTVVLKPREQNKAWAKYSLSGETTPVKHLALNLGAPGDRRASDGTLWLGYPRPGGSLVLKFDAAVSTYPGGGYFKLNPDFVTVKGTDDPWLYSSGVRGLRRCEIPLLKPEDGSMRYTVRLGFAAIEGSPHGRGTFGIRLQGKTVAERFGLGGRERGAEKAVVKEFEGIDVKDKLAIELVAQSNQPEPEAMPVLQTVEVVREKVLSLGFTVPTFLLNTMEPEQSGNVTIANHKDRAFSGYLSVTAPKGFSITPSKPRVKVSPGKTIQITLKAKVRRKGKAGRYPVKIKLLRSNRRVESERETEIQYLGDRGRVVLKPVADGYVGAGFASSNRFSQPSMLVDGGHREIGDRSHHVAYLKFKLDVPGKPFSATLRIWNSKNPTSDGGNVCLVTDPWDEEIINYTNRPKPGKVLANLGRVAPHQMFELPLDLKLDAMKELSLAIDPVNCDGTDYITLEGGKPAELIVEYGQ